MNAIRDTIAQCAEPLAQGPVLVLQEFKAALEAGQGLPQGQALGQ